MNLRASSRWLRVFVSLLLVVGAGGCVSTDSPDSDPASPTPTMTPFSFAELDSETAKNASLHAEEAYLENTLEGANCVEEWGTYATVMSEEATVVNETADSVVVNVTHPYWYSTERDEVDGGSRATYEVTRDGPERVAGDDLSPC